MIDAAGENAWMSEAEAVGWRAERERLLRATWGSLWLLDRSPDRGRFEWKIERATRHLPRLRQRIVEDPLGVATPRWQVDPGFDLAYHVRLLRAPHEASLRALLDLAEPLVMQGFDRDRPLWELYLIEGLARGRAALLVKWHPSLEGTQGPMPLGAALVERFRAAERDWVPQPVGTPLPEARGPIAETLDAVAHRAGAELARFRDLGGEAARALASFVTTAGRSGLDAGAAVAALARSLRGDAATAALPPERSATLHLDCLTVPLADVTRAAKASRATVGDALVAGVAAGLRIYHELHGTPLGAIRVSPPIDRRRDVVSTGACTGALLGSLLVTAGREGPAERVRAVHAAATEHRRTWPRAEAISAVLARLPAKASSALLGRAGCAVDLGTTVLPPIGHDRYLSGARVERIVAFAPLGGAAAQVTALAYGDTLTVGLGTDRAAMPDPEIFVRCVQRGFDEVLAQGAGRSTAWGRAA